MTNSSDLIESLPPKSFIDRYLRNILNPGGQMFIALTIIIYYISGFSVELAVLLTFLIIYLIVCFIESVNTITNIRVTPTQVILDYNHINKGKILVFDKSKLRVECFQNSKGSMFSFHLVVQDNSGNKLTQYSVGRWDKKTLKRLCDKLEYML